MANLFNSGGLQGLALMASAMSNKPGNFFSTLQMLDQMDQRTKAEAKEAKKEASALNYLKSAGLMNGRVGDMQQAPQIADQVFGGFGPETDTSQIDLMKAAGPENLLNSRLSSLQPDYKAVDGIGLVDTHAKGGPKVVIAPGPKAPQFETIYDSQGREQKVQVLPDGSYKPIGGPKAGTVGPERWELLPPDEAAARGLPKGGTYEISSNGQTRAVVAPTKEMGPAAMKVANAEIGAKGILYGLDKFKTAIKEAPDGAQMSSLFGGMTPAGQKLNTAWTNAALLAKGEELYNLGVLSGPDLGIIQKALPDPSTAGGALKDKASYYEAIKQVEDLVNARLKATQDAYGGDQSPAPKAPARPPGPPPIGKNGKPMIWVP